MRGVRLYTPPNPDEDAGYLDAAGVAHGGDGTQSTAAATSGGLADQANSNASASGSDGDIYTQAEAEAAQAQAGKLDPNILAAAPEGARVVYLSAGQPDSNGKLVASAPGDPIAPGDVVVLGGSSAYLVTDVGVDPAGKQDYVMTLQPLLPPSTGTAGGEVRSTDADTPYLEGLVPEVDSYLQGVAPTEEEGWPDQEWDFGLNLPGDPGVYDGPSHIDGRVLSEEDDLFAHEVMRFIVDKYGELRNDTDPFTSGDRLGPLGLDAVVAAATSGRGIGPLAGSTSPAEADVGIEIKGPNLTEDVANVAPNSPPPVPAEDPPLPYSSKLAEGPQSLLDDQAAVPVASDAAEGLGAAEPAPTLAIADQRAMFQDAVNALKAAPPEVRAAWFADFASQIESASSGAWSAKPLPLADGGTLFVGDAGRGFAIAPDGSMYAGVAEDMYSLTGWPPAPNYGGGKLIK
jgi:hypothetical protein